MEGQTYVPAELLPLNLLLAAPADSKVTSPIESTNSIDASPNDSGFAGSSLTPPVLPMSGQSSQWSEGSLSTSVEETSLLSLVDNSGGSYVNHGIEDHPDIDGSYLFATTSAPTKSGDLLHEGMQDIPFAGIAERDNIPGKYNINELLNDDGSYKMGTTSAPTTSSEEAHKTRSMELFQRERESLMRNPGTSGIENQQPEQTQASTSPASLPTRNYAGNVFATTETP